jgi:uncharacterized membrane protein YeaQ/YmgE (transglycosylase-associated protein family)
MFFIPLILIGIAAGYLAPRVMKLETDVPTTIAIGVGGALIGGFALRFLISLMGWMAGFVGAFLGALALIWVYKTYFQR